MLPITLRLRPVVVVRAVTHAPKVLNFIIELVTVNMVYHLVTRVDTSYKIVNYPV
jgi:hypothetical protein